MRFHPFSKGNTEVDLLVVVVVGRFSIYIKVDG